MNYSEEAIEKLISNISIMVDCYQCPVQASCKHECIRGCYAEEHGQENEIRRVLQEWSVK